MPTILDGHAIISPIDNHFRSRDKRSGFGGGEKKSGADKFLFVTEPSHRSMIHDGLHTVGGKDFTVLFGGEEAWNQYVDSYFVRGPFASEVFAQVVNRAFAGGIGKHPG